MFRSKNPPSVELSSNVASIFLAPVIPVTVDDKVENPLEKKKRVYGFE